MQANTTQETPRCVLNAFRNCDHLLETTKDHKDRKFQGDRVPEKTTRW